MAPKQRRAKAAPEPGGEPQTSAGRDPAAAKARAPPAALVAAAAAAALAAAGLGVRHWLAAGVASLPPAEPRPAEASRGQASAAPPREAGPEDVAALHSGRCGEGTAERPGEVTTVGLHQLRQLRLPDGIRCPFVIGGLEGLRHWGSLSRMGDLDQLEKLTSGSITFDASSSGEFAYWDNNSLLASDVRNVGIAGQGYTKVTGKKRRFFAELRKGRDSSLGAVRYGGPIKTYFDDLPVEQEHLAELPLSGGRSLSMWLSSAGSYSTAHMDSFHNIFMMLGGEKRVLLAPSADAHLFGTYPGTHPLARQARWHFGLDGSPPRSGNASERVLSATVGRGEALFIPANWFHHVIATSTAISLAMTALPPEHKIFNDWMQSGTHAVLPFTAANGPWTTDRLAKTTPAFISALLKKLGRASGGANPLHVFANVSYGLQTRKELGWPPLERYPVCGPPAKADKRAAASAAKVIAKRFAEFRADLVGPYIGPYLETTLSRLAGSEKNPSRIMAQAVSYVETCLA